MIERLHERFRVELGALRALFGQERVDTALARMEEIHEYTEAVWQVYVETLRGGVVRKLLIAEAPPWSIEGTPQYVLDPASRVRTLMRALRQAFPGARAGSAADALNVMAQNGFLLLDSIPFSMDYGTKRSSPRYDDLVRLTARSYLQAKIDASPLEWSPDLRIAFALERNARSILRATRQLAFDGRSVAISIQMVAVNGAGYPDASKLCGIFGLDVP